ncbi:MAG TPA: hypothetical protein VIK64_01445 [Anaerolineales bacterium]
MSSLDSVDQDDCYRPTRFQQSGGAGRAPPQRQPVRWRLGPDHLLQL